MRLSRSKKQALGILLAGILLLGIIWFTVPRLIIRAFEYNAFASKAQITSTLPKEAREKIERDIASIEQDIKVHDTKGASNAMQQYIALGIDFETLGNMSFALDAYKRASKEDSSYYLPYANVGGAYQAMKQFPQAINAYRKAIDVKQEEFSTYKKLADLYQYDLKNLEQARGAYLEGLIRTKNDLGLMKPFALFLEQTGDNSTALLYWDALHKLLPEDIDVTEHLNKLSPPKPAAPAKKAPVPVSKKK